MGKFKPIDDIMKVAKSAESHTFGEFDINFRLSSKGNKGSMGQILEEGLFGYEINSRNEADFAEQGVELKVTPVKYLTKKKDVVAKERLVLNIINFNDEYKHDFYDSSFWHKNEKLLIMFYLWQEGLERKDYTILKAVLHEFDDKDLAIIKRDWEIIKNKILEGKAHEISESDTMYLAACTKGANKSSVRTQPFSDKPAKQRAFSLKPSYMNAFIDKVINKKEVISLLSEEELQEKSVEELLQERFAPYVGLSFSEIIDKSGYTGKLVAKNINMLVTAHILGVGHTTKLNTIEEFAKANIVFKTIVLEPSGKPKESMSFEQINFTRWLSTPFEKSQIYEKFEYTKFLFVVYEYRETEKENPNREKYLKGVYLWNMPEQVIQHEVYELWKEVRDILQKGVIIEERDGKEYNNFPKSSFNGVTHIRPKGANGEDKIKLPNGQEIVKQTFWLNNSYIAKIIQELEDERTK